MAALANVGWVPSRSCDQETYLVKNNTKIWGNSLVGVDTTTGRAQPFAAGNANLVCVGVAQETVEAGTNMTVSVKPSGCSWDFQIDNDTAGTPMTAAMIEKDVYGLDDHTGTAASSGNSKLGILKGVSAESPPLKIWVRLTR